MLIVTKSANNTWVLTLREKQTVDANGNYPYSYFLFKLTNDMQKTVKRFIAPDISEYTDRYNKFTITESSSENLTSGTVSLVSGTWKYEVYEQSSSSNLDENNSDNRTPIEKGRVKVIGTSPTYNKPNSSQTFTQYVGNNG